MKLLGGTGRIITKDKSSDNVPKLQIAEVVLVKGNIVNDQFQQYSGSCLQFFQIRVSVSY